MEKCSVVLLSRVHPAPLRRSISDYKLFTYKRCFPMALFVFVRVFPTAHFWLVSYTALLSLPPSLSYFQVLENYNKGKTALLSAAKIMVSPTEVDLNAETYFHGVSNSHEPTPQTQHRRNSSVRSCARSEISLDGFSECPPPAVPVVLMGARERLALELRERKAPLAVMESLSDVDSVYSMDSRRSSTAFRGSPCLGTLPFPLDAPIPEENPSLSSRTELIQASPERELMGQTGPCCPTPPEHALPPNQSHSLSPDLVVPSNQGRSLSQTNRGGHFPRFTPKHIGEGQPGQQKALLRTKSETFEVFQRSNSKDLSPVAPWTGIIREECGENPKNEGVKKEEKGTKAVRVAPLSNGNTSQAVLEFAQYLDSLFKLDGSDSLPPDNSDAESESGRGSSVQTEEQRMEDLDSEQQLLARATLEPNLVPKPPRTFAGSAEPSSGISLSPSFPLSSSGEMNDLSPGNHAVLRTSSASPYAEENTLSSIV